MKPKRLDKTSKRTRLALTKGDGNWLIVKHNHLGLRKNYLRTVLEHGMPVLGRLGN